MSARFDSVMRAVPAGRRCGWLLACLSLVLHGCGSPGPVRPDAGAAAAQQPSEAVPADAVQSYDRALAAMLAGDDTEAELELEQLVLQYPGYPGPYVNLAILHGRSGRIPDAREALDRALELDPMHPAANNQLGILLRTEGLFVEAEAAYRRAIEADPSYALAYYNLGVLLDLYMKRPADALKNYERFQELLPEPDETVGRWIIDLRRRIDAANASRVARENAA